MMGTLGDLLCTHGERANQISSSETECLNVLPSPPDQQRGIKIRGFGPLVGRRTVFGSVITE